MNSLPTIVEPQTNDERFLQVLMQGDPELARVYAYIRETNFNTAILPPLIRTLSNLAMGTGFGKVQIFMESRVITAIKPEESNKVNLPVVDDSVESV